METVSDVLSYIRGRSVALPDGQWIEVRQVFITRLKDQRYPTRAELDLAAPRHPVIFQTGPDASLNTLALQTSGIDRNFRVSDGGTGFIEKDPTTGEPTGILRNCTRYVKVQSPLKKPTADDRAKRLRELLRDYNASGLTAVCERDASPADIDVYQALRGRNELSVRVAVSHHVESIGALNDIQAEIRRIAAHPLARTNDPMLRIIGVKAYLDGGMLTGSAYMREPWGVSEIYNITDPAYRGVRFIEPERLRDMVRAAAETGLQFTAHSVGDGAVHALLDAYEEVSRELPLRKTRPCVSHSNFMSREAVEKAARLGVCLDIQPAWLYLDTHTLAKQFGYDRLRYFQPLRSLFAAGVVVGGGSDHMQKIGADRAINLYSPFLGMQTAVTRQSRYHDRPLHPEEALTREQAIQYYTINNARIMSLDEQTGSLEAGKLADLIVIDRDLLRCEPDQIGKTKVLRTYVGGKLVHEGER
jgi:predicted amidohydrolase YtcJ